MRLVVICRVGGRFCVPRRVDRGLNNRSGSRAMFPRAPARGGGVQKSLSVRTHVYPSRGLVEIRDVKAAKNSDQTEVLPSGKGTAGLPVELRSLRL